MQTILAAAAINGVDYNALKDTVPELDTFTNEKDYEQAAVIGRIARESQVMQAALLHEKLRVHFDKEESIKVLCAILQANGSAAAG